MVKSNERQTGEPQKKKPKLGNGQELDAIFRYILTSREKRRLTDALLFLKRGLWDLNLASLHIDDCNARSYVPFSEATVSTTPIKWEEDKDKPEGISFQEIFKTGVDVLEKFLGESPKIPENKQMLSALQKLLMFLSKEPGDHRSLFEKQNSEFDRSVTLAQHLLSPLAVDSTYTVSAPPSSQVEGLPPTPNDDLVGKEGDTSFGCTNGWHGYADILMESLPVSVIPTDAFGDSTSQTFEETDTGTPDDRSVSSVEVKMKPDFYENEIHQIIAETIVFSFLQQKLNKDIFQNTCTLIPGIGISGNKLLLTYYDSVSDVLLLCKARPLFEEGKSINLVSILALWLTLNHRLFCTGVTERMNKYKADFHERVADLLKNYSHQVEKPFHGYRKIPGVLFPWSKETRRCPEEGMLHVEYSDLP